MTITIEREELKTLLEGAAMVAVASYVREQAPAKDRVSQRKAYEMFGESRVKAWVRDRMVEPIRVGTTKRSTRFYSIAELRALDVAEGVFPLLNRKIKAG